MEKQRKIKILSIVALVLAICALTLGYAAFSTTLNISSSASVTPDSSEFKLHLHNQTTHPSSFTEQRYNIVGYNGALASTTARYHPMEGLSIPFMQGSFTAPGQYVELIVYIVNEGAYDAYLNDIIFNNYDGTDSFVYCSIPDGSDATQSLVDAACDDFSVTVDIDGNMISYDNQTLSNYVLKKGEAALLTIRMIYNENGDRADGAFNVNFGNIEIDFSTVASASLISFTIDVTEYHAEEGMTWEEWVNSSYNTDGFELSNNVIVASDKDYYIFYSDYFTYVDKNSIISSTEKYCTLMTPL